MKYFLFILGCQYNEWDGARLRYFLDANGLRESSEKDADLIVVVACSVRQTAIDRIFGKLKNWTHTDLSHRKGTEGNKTKSKRVIITGCVLKNDIKKFEERFVTIIKPGDFESLTQYLNSNFDIKKATNYQLLATSCSYVPIMTGCNNFCSYCAVPYTRGREKSRPFDDVIFDVKKLISSGHKKIMLLGQNVNSYKLNNKPKINNDKLKSDFTKLLEKINGLDGDFEISFTSNHPKDLSDDIIHAVSKLSKIKKEIHLPLQSGSDKILKAMNRPYSKNQYMKIVEKIRSIDPKIDITTDVIVGFPGETKKDFEETVAVFKKVDFKQAFVNKYSPRSETMAFKLGDPIKWSEKQSRWRVLNDIANK